MFKILRITSFLLTFFLLSCGGSDNKTTKTNDVPLIELASTLVVFENTEVKLTALVTDSDGHIVSYAWTQLEDINIDLPSNDTSSISFTSPEINDFDGAQKLIFELTVKDNDGATAKARINVIVNPNIEANAGADQTAFVGDNIVLDCGESFIDGVSYTWTQTSGSTINLLSGTKCSASFETSALEGDYEFELEASGENEKIARDTVKVTVNNYAGERNAWQTPSELNTLAINKENVGEFDNIKKHGEHLFLSTDTALKVISIDENKQIVVHQTLENITGFFVEGDRVFSLSANGLLQVYRISGHVFELEKETSLSSILDGAEIVHYDQQLLFIEDSNFLHVIEIDVAGNAQSKSKITNNSSKAKQIELFEEQLFIRYRSNVSVYDFSDTSTPALLWNKNFSNQDAASWADSFLITKENLFILTSYYDTDFQDITLEAYDISTPSDIKHVWDDDISLSLTAQNTYMQLDNNYLYVFSSGMLNIYLLNNGTIESKISQSIAFDNILMQGSVIYAINSGLMSIFEHNGQSLNVLCSYITGSEKILSSTTDSHYIYYIDSNQRFSFVLLEDLPNKCGAIPASQLSNAQIENSTVLDDENVLLVPTSNNKIGLWYGQSDSEINKQDEIDTNATSPKFALSNEHVFYTASENVIAVKSRQGLAQEIITTIDLEQQIDTLTVQDNKLLVAAEKTLYLYNIENIDSVVLTSKTILSGLGTEAPSTVRSIDIHDNKAFIQPSLSPSSCQSWSADRIANIVVDLSAADDIKELSTTGKDACTRTDLALDDTYLFSMGDYYVWVSNFNNPGEQLVSSYDTNIAPIDIVSVNNTLVVANQDNASSLIVLALTSEEKLEMETTIPLSDIPTKLVKGADNIVYVTLENQGILVVDFSTPLSPLLLGWARIPSDHILVGTDYLYFLKDDKNTATSTLSARNKHWLQDDFKVNNSFQKGAVGERLSYQLSWQSDDIEQVTCHVTGGTCQLSEFNDVTKSGKVIWELPLNNGDYEISINAGNELRYAVSTDLITIN